MKRKCYVLAVTTTPLAWDGTCDLVGDVNQVRVAAGLHPALVPTRHKEVDQLCSLLSKTLYVGEIGLDGSKTHRSSLFLQRRILDKVLRACEFVGGRVISIHSRGATAQVLDHLETRTKAGVPVMHWFSGTVAELERSIEIGCWFSVGPAMLRGRNGRRLASLMPKNRVLTETDGPFARRGRVPLMPWDVADASTTLAEVWGVSVARVHNMLGANFIRLMDMVKHKGNYDGFGDFPKWDK